MQARQKMFEQRGGYVAGRAADEELMGGTFTRVINAWVPPFPGGRAKYVDY